MEPELKTYLEGMEDRIKTDFRSEMSTMGKELRLEMSALGTELRSEMSTMKSELQTEIHEVAEVTAKILETVSTKADEATQATERYGQRLQNVETAVWEIKTKLAR